jgi:hypothetical protein
VQGTVYPWRNLEIKALSSLHKLLRNRLGGKGGIEQQPLPPPHTYTLTNGSVTINAKTTVHCSSQVPPCVPKAAATEGGYHLAAHARAAGTVNHLQRPPPSLPFHQLQSDSVHFCWGRFSSHSPCLFLGMGIGLSSSVPQIRAHAPQ